MGVGWCLGLVGADTMGRDKLANALGVEELARLEEPL
jgi:hypothetical protein